MLILPRGFFRQRGRVWTCWYDNNHIYQILGLSIENIFQTTLIWFDKYSNGKTPSPLYVCIRSYIPIWNFSKNIGTIWYEIIIQVWWTALTSLILIKLPLHYRQWWQQWWWLWEGGGWWLSYNHDDDDHGDDYDDDGDDDDDDDDDDADQVLSQVVGGGEETTTPFSNIFPTTTLPTIGLFQKTYFHTNIHACITQKFVKGCLMANSNVHASILMKCSFPQLFWPCFGFSGSFNQIHLFQLQKEMGLGGSQVCKTNTFLSPFQFLDQDVTLE